MCSKEKLWWEFHVSRFCLFHHDWKAFSFTPWLPHRLVYQAIYVAYRWISMLIYLAYLLKTGIQSESPYYLQDLMTWGMILQVAQLTWSVGTVTYTFIRTLVLGKKNHKPSCEEDKDRLNRPLGCCGASADSTSWYHKIQWVLFTISTEFAVGIAILYWLLIHGDGTGHTIDDNKIISHFMSGLLAYLDLWITGIPVRLYHFYMVVMASGVYVVFSGIHYVVLITTDSISDNDSHLVSAFLYAILATVIFLPLVHVFFYISYLLREVLLVFVKKCECKKDAQSGIEM